MYILTQHTSDTAPRAYRIKEDQDIWFELAHGAKLAMSPAEAQQLIAELQRDLAAVEAIARRDAAIDPDHAAMLRDSVKQVSA